MAGISDLLSGVSDRAKAYWQGVPAGGFPTDAPIVTPAPPLDHYPTAAEIPDGFAYGSGHEAYIDGNASNILPFSAVGVPSTMLADMMARRVNGVPAPQAVASVQEAKSGKAGKGKGAKDAPAVAQPPRVRPEDLQRSRDIMEAAQLAANRIATAGLGFDPARIALDTKSGPDVNIVGSYYPDQGGKPYDVIYQNADYPSTATHESIHRGIEQVRQAGLYPDRLTGIPEESVVRWLMATQAGNPEAGRGSAADGQINAARLWFQDNPYRQQGIAALERASADLVAKRRPGGPR